MSARAVEVPGGYDAPRRMVAPARLRQAPVLALLAAGGVLAGIAALLLLLGPALGLAVPSQELLRPAALVALAGGLSLVTAGLGVVVFGPVKAGPEAAAVGFGSHRVVLVTTLFATFLALLASSVLPLALLGASGERSVRSGTGFVVAALAVSAVLLGVAYFRFIRPGVVSVTEFGFGRNRLSRYFFNQVWLAHFVTGVSGAFMVMMLSGSIQLLLRQLGIHQNQLADLAWIRSLAPADFGLILLAGSVVGPLAEEIFFRGLVFQSYLRAKGPLVAYVASSLVFATLHLNVPAFIPILVLGIVLAWLYRSTGSLMPCLLAHGFNNGIAFLVLYFGPQNLGS